MVALILYILRYHKIDFVKSQIHYQYRKKLILWYDKIDMIT